MIRLEAIRKTFFSAQGDVEVLRGIDLEVERGDIFGIIGRSGAGKSTLVRCINMLERPSSGRVWVEGADLTRLDSATLRAMRRRIGMIFQHFNILSSCTVRDNVALPLELAGMGRSAVDKRVYPLLDLVGLADRRDAYPAQLSGGQKQRVGIARALAPDPAVLLCDEATSALDPETTTSILALLKNINATLGLTIVLITHEMSVVKQTCSRVAVLEAGRVVETGRVFDVFTNPRSDTAQSFVREVDQQELPEDVAARMRPEPGPGALPLLRITFSGDSAEKPVISELVRRFDLSLNIMEGRVDAIQGVPFGVLTVIAHGADEETGKALNYMRSLGVKAEILGYVDDDPRFAL